MVCWLLGMFESILHIRPISATGLHFEDVSKLLGAFRKLIAAGHSLIGGRNDFGRAGQHALVPVAPVACLRCAAYAWDAGRSNTTSS